MVKLVARITVAPDIIEYTMMKVALQQIAEMGTPLSNTEPAELAKMVLDQLRDDDGA